VRHEREAAVVPAARGVHGQARRAAQQARRALHPPTGVAACLPCRDWCTRWLARAAHGCALLRLTRKRAKPHGQVATTGTCDMADFLLPLICLKAGGCDIVY
jgi:hypothetical protein